MQPLRSHQRLLLARRDDAILVDVNMARFMQLAHEFLGLLVLGLQLIEHGQLLLGLSEARQLGLDVLLAEERLLLVCLHLSLSASPLRADLEHVSRGAFLDCMLGKRDGLELFTMCDAKA